MVRQTMEALGVCLLMGMSFGVKILTSSLVATDAHTWLLRPTWSSLTLQLTSSKPAGSFSSIWLKQRWQYKEASVWFSLFICNLIIARDFISKNQPTWEGQSAFDIKGRHLCSKSYSTCPWSSKRPNLQHCIKVVGRCQFTSLTPRIMWSSSKDGKLGRTPIFF